MCVCVNQGIIFESQAQSIKVSKYGKSSWKVLLGK